MGPGKPQGEKEKAILLMLNVIREYVVSFFDCQKKIKAVSPGLHRRFYENKKKKRTTSDADDAITNKDKKDSATRNSRHRGTTTDMASTVEGRNTGSLRNFPAAEVMRAVENLAGHLLSKIHACGIEIRIEVLRVQESLAQMVAVAETLHIRIEKVKVSQEKFMKDFTAAT